MSTSVLQEFLVKIGFDVNKAQLSAVDAGLAKAGASVGLLDKEVTAASASIDTRLTPALKSMLLPLAGITAAIGYAYKKTFDFIKESADGFEQVAHLANRVNTTADAIKKLGYIAQFTGSSVEAAEISLDGLNRAAGSAALGVGRSKKIFQEIGVNIRDSNGRLKDTTELLYEVGNAVKGMERGKQLAVLSRLGIDPTLINALTTDVTKLSNEYDRVMKSAGIDNNKAAESAVRFAEASKRVGNIWKAIKDAVAASFFDQFAKGFNAFSDTLINNLPQIVGLLKPLITSMIKVANVALQIGLIFAGVANNIIKLISKINTATGGWAIKISAIIYAWKKLNLAFLASPIGIILELATAFSLLYDDYKTWERGGKSFIDWGNRSGKIIKYVAETLAILSTGFLALKTALYAARTAAIAFEAAMNLNPIILAITSLIYFAKKLHDIFLSVNGDIDKLVEKSSKLFQMPGLNLANNITQRMHQLMAPSAIASNGQTKNVTFNNNTAINVNSTANAQDVAVAIKNQQRAIYANQIRNEQGAVR